MEADLTIRLTSPTVVVRKDAIERSFPGGLAGFTAMFGGGSYLEDEHLAAVGGMDPGDTERFVRFLARFGLTHLLDSECRDLAVVDPVEGTGWRCPWLELDLGADEPTCRFVERAGAARPCRKG